MALVDQPPLELACDHGRPCLAQLAVLGISVALCPTIDVRQQRPLGEPEVAIQPLERVPSQQDLEGRPEHLAKLEVDPPDGAVEIDLVIEVETRVEEHVERFGGVGMESEAAFRDEGVMDDPLHVDRTGRHATYIGIARDVVHVVGRVRAAQGRPQCDEPGRRLESLQLARRDEKGDPPRVNPFAALEVCGGRRPELSHQVRERTCDQLASDHLVVEVPRVQVVLVEEVAERPVANVVKQPRDAHRLLHELRRRHIAHCHPERPVKVLRPLAGEVHGAERVLEARVLRGREHPPRALQLVDPAQALQPSGIDQVLLRRLPGDSPGAAFGDAKVTIDGIAR